MFECPSPMRSNASCRVVARQLAREVLAQRVADDQRRQLEPFRVRRGGDDVVRLDGHQALRPLGVELARRARRSRGRSGSVARPPSRTSRRGSPRASARTSPRRLSASTFASFHVRAPRAVSASAQSAALHAGHLVRRDRGARCPSSSTRSPARRGPRPRRGRRARRPRPSRSRSPSASDAVRDRLVPALAQLVEHRAGDGRVHVTRDRDLHRRGGYRTAAHPGRPQPDPGTVRSRAGRSGIAMRRDPLARHRSRTAARTGSQREAVIARAAVEA